MITQPLFGAWDYVVLILVMVISSAIGVYYRFTGGKQKTMQEYLLADRNMAITPVAFSLMASFMSAITLLGVSSENYTYGIQFVIINFSYLIFTPIAAYLYIPVFFKLQAMSAYEYLEKRFGKLARLAASLCYTLQMTLYMGIVLFGPALALEALTGISQVTAILSFGLVCIFYSTIGGIKAVLITDVFQSVLMFASVLSIIICAVIDKGSIAEIWRIAAEGGRTELFNFDPDPTVRHSFFSLIIGGGVTFLSLYAVNQTQIQRYLTIKDLKNAQKALWWNWPILTILSLCTSFSGLAIYSRYYNCDPYNAKYISSFDQLMPYYVVDTMGRIPGISGIFVGGIFSASISTVSSSLNSLAAITFEDYVKPIYKWKTKTSLLDANAGILVKCISLAYGILCLAVAFLARYLGGVLQAALTIFGVVGGPLLGLFTLGMFTITANEEGAVLGLTTGIIFALLMAFGKKPPPKTLPRSTDGCNLYMKVANNYTSTITSNDNSEYFWLYRISYLYNGVLGLVVTLIIGYSASVIISKCTGRAKKDYDPNLFVPPLAKIMRKTKSQSVDMYDSKNHTSSQDTIETSIRVKNVYY